ncbi:MAG: anti-sigma regulatory factor [Actinobacteria bacterium]|nr:anti-sigma regulatory factor [Actinomycetota bacterium]
MPDEVRVIVDSDTDVVIARQRGRSLAARQGFSSTDQTLVATAISELARNIVVYAKSGEIIMRLIQESGRSGIVIVAHDEGPGIANIEQALQDGYSTGGSLGLGLPGTKRLMDEFEIVSAVGRGTTITAKKWL